MTVRIASSWAGVISASAKVVDGDTGPPACRRAVDVVIVAAVVATASMSSGNGVRIKALPNVSAATTS